jgi:hypothetical protein
MKFMANNLRFGQSWPSYRIRHRFDGKLKMDDNEAATEP